MKHLLSRKNRRDIKIEVQHGEIKYGKRLPQHKTDNTQMTLKTHKHNKIRKITHNNYKKYGKVNAKNLKTWVASQEALV